MFVQMILRGGVRSFGIAGIPFNDMLAAATIIVFCFLLFLDQSKRGWRIVFFLFLISLLLTLTRVVWLGVTLTIMFLSSYLFTKKRPLFGRLFRKELAPILISGLVLLMAATAVKPDMLRQVRNRFNQLSEFQYGDQVTSTLTRVLIWDTAINAFKKNPINGVGLDQFPHASREYYTIHPMLYEFFVEGKDPHLLFLTFLTETGVIGAAGFLVLLISSYLMALKGYKMSSTNEEKALGLSLLGIMFYIAASSFYSGSWFYGQNSYQFMLFLAATSAFYQLRKDNYARN
jgi:O-antigen ligase